jgi:hypothetical protein
MPNLLEGSSFLIYVEATNQYGSSQLSEGKVMKTASPPELNDYYPITFG